MKQSLNAVGPQTKLNLPSWAQTAPWSEWFKGGMLIRSRSIKLRKALCLGPKNNFPTLSPLSVLGGSGGGVCLCIFHCVCSVFMYVVLPAVWSDLTTQIMCRMGWCPHKYSDCFTKHVFSKMVFLSLFFFSSFKGNGTHLCIFTIIW